MPLNFYQPPGGPDEMQPQSPQDTTTLPEGAEENAPMLGEPTPVQFDEFGFPLRDATSQDRQASIARDMANLNRRSGQFKAKQKMVEEKMTQLREDFVRKVLEMMSEAGANPHDPASVARLLESMNNNDPDLVALFEMALEGLDPDEGVGEEQAPEMMNRMRGGRGMVEDTGAMEMGQLPEVPEIGGDEELPQE